MDERIRHTIRAWLTSAHAEPPLILAGTSAHAWGEDLKHIRCMAVCSQQSGSCDSCTACKQAAAGTHPDIVEVVREEDGSIPIANVRQALKTLRRTPVAGRHLFILPLVEGLRAESAAVLLKELEEAAPTTRFLLTSAFPSRILPTIRSRSQVIRMSPESSDDLEASGNSGDANTVDITPILETSKRRTLSDEELETIGAHLRSAPLADADRYRALLRLRDYYKIRAYKGNQQLAADTLLATLRAIHHNQTQTS